MDRQKVVVFLLAAPYVALPIYLVVGRSRFHGYVAERKALTGAFAAIRRFAARGGCAKGG